MGLPAPLQKSQVKTLWAWLIRMPARIVRHARQLSVKLIAADPLAHVLWEAIPKLQRLRGPTLLLRG